MKIRIILTGGTIDQSFSPTSPKQFIYDKTHINEMLAEARSRLDLVIEDLMALNSEEMNDSHVQKIVDACVKSDENKIVILHGTNTMTDTARKLGEKIKDKTVVLTGAMVPFAIAKSDALFNLGTALAAVQILNNGVFVAMNGKIFESDNVRKNKEIGEFQTDSKVD